jgi:hypothetical protein
MNKNQIKDIGIDTGLYLGTKYILHVGADLEYTKNINPGDAAVFIVTDILYHYLYMNKKYTSLEITDNPTYNCDINKYGGLIIGVSLLNFLTGRKERVIDNIISVGVSGAVSAIIDAMRGGTRCVKEFKTEPKI